VTQTENKTAFHKPVAKFTISTSVNITTLPREMQTNFCYKHYYYWFISTVLVEMRGITK